MNRAEFFSEMGKGLFKTIKEISSPFISEDLEKLDSIADDLAGVKWHVAGNKESLGAEEFHDLFIAGQSIVLLNNQKNFEAYKKFCSSCQTMPQWISYERKFKCLSCEKEYDIEKGSGELTLKSCPVKITGENVYIGIS